MVALASVVGLFAGVSCTDRRLEERPVIDVEGLCHEYCVRLMECVWTPDGPASFDDLEGCESTCRDIPQWTTTCDEIQAEMYECYVEYECPEFSEMFMGYPPKYCAEELDALMGCVPGDPR